jgi:hypothetical protein
MRKKPRFRIGDTVKIRKTGDVVKITDRIYQQPKPVQAIKVYTDGKTSVGSSFLGEDWLYKLTGARSYRFSEECLESAVECPCCGAVGWDWVTGCGDCRLSPEDFN